MAAKAAYLPTYLDRYAEADAVRAAKRVAGVYEQVLVVPAFDEPTDFLDALLPADAQQLLVILVANMPDDASVSTMPAGSSRNRARLCTTNWVLIGRRLSQGV